MPARNEERDICVTLGSLANQTGSNTFHVIVFANNCSDSTANAVREFAVRHPHLSLSVAEGILEPPADHVGTARKALMDFAANHFLTTGKPGGIIATTDADTRVATNWVSETCDEMRNVDAVAGFVEIGESERQSLPATVRELYGKENAFRQAWAELEWLLDPLPEDPYPRHCSFVAASFAVTAEMYRRAGGLPDVAALEDRFFVRALRRADARIRFSRRVRAATSGRHDARVEGGFGTLVKHLHGQGMSGGTFMVENPRQIADEARGRAALRRLWHGSNETADLSIVSEIFGLSKDRLLELVDRSKTFGENYETMERAATRKRSYPLVSVGEAIDGLRATAAELKAAAPTRIRAASGAG
jgi:hypothetical protein